MKKIPYSTQEVITRNPIVGATSVYNVSDSKRTSYPVFRQAPPIAIPLIESISATFPFKLYTSNWFGQYDFTGAVTSDPPSAKSSKTGIISYLPVEAF